MPRIIQRVIEYTVAYPGKHAVSRHGLDACSIAAELSWTTRVSYRGRMKRGVIKRHSIVSRKDEAFCTVGKFHCRVFTSLFHGGAQCHGTEENGARSWEDAVASGGGSVEPLMHCPSACLCSVWLPL